jgi:hypothetical protein
MGQGYTAFASMGRFIHDIKKNSPLGSCPIAKYISSASMMTCEEI